jgi:hypothetical protein
MYYAIVHFLLKSHDLVFQRAGVAKRFCEVPTTGTAMRSDDAT